MLECLDNDLAIVEVVVLGENQFNPDAGPQIISENVEIHIEDLENKTIVQGSSADQDISNITLGEKTSKLTDTEISSDTFVPEEEFPNNDLAINMNDPSINMGKKILFSIGREAPSNENKLSAKSRKNIRKVQTWKCNERKKKRQAGEEYISSRKKKVPRRENKNKKDCRNKCKYNCSKKISELERKHIFDSYYSVDQNRKYDFIGKTTSRMIKGRNTSSKNESRRNFKFKYYFFINDKQVQVCKDFYLSTIHISQKVVYNLHQRKDRVTGLAQSDQRGKRGTRAISEDQRQFARDHINSFPCVESHYCRARTSKSYLDPTLNISKMYELYVQSCEEQTKVPVKESYYRFLFCTEFNLGFHVPKTDRCGTCAACEILLKDGNEIMQILSRLTAHT